jgi:hypothetical protein
MEIISYDVYIDPNDEEIGLDKISLVKRPAIMVDFIAMNEEESLYKQIQLSDDKMIMTGPVLIPDLEIIRKDSEGPFYIRYSKDEIEKIAQDFWKYKGQRNVNKDHKENQAEDTYIYESWITGPNKGAGEGFDLPDGSLMVTMKVDNVELWDEIKSGKYKGFSIEGLFRFKKSDRIIKQECKITDVFGTYQRKELEEINLFVENIEDESHIIIMGVEPGAKETEEEFVSRCMGNTDMNNEFPEQDQRAAVCYTKWKTKLTENMVSTILKDGMTLYTDAELFEVGADVYFKDDNDQKMNVDNGEYELEDGTILSIEDGKIKEIKEMNAMETVKQEVVTMDMIMSYFDPKFEALMALLAPKSDESMSEVKQSLEEISLKLEKVSLEKEMKEINPLDKKIQTKTKFDYDSIVKYNKKF